MPRVVAAADGAQIQLTASRGTGQQVLFIAAEGDPAAGGVEDQCREIYARIGQQLTAMGSSLDQVVKTTEYVTPAGIAAYRKTADVRREVFSDPYPAATGVICERLVHPDAQLAVDVIAVTGPA
jgi:enamine deaminase RidA (YjgF/YER057c/UK114 family)